MKLCTDCEHYGQRVCYRPTEGFSPVTGERMHRQLNCAEERGYRFPFDALFRACGREGRFFTPRVTTNDQGELLPRC